MSSAIEGILTLIGGTGLFLYAITRFGDGVQKLAGEKIKIILESQFRKPAPNILTGIGMAAALQNNFLTQGMISSLVKAGLMGLLPAIWILLGTNLGMTLTAHLMALNIGIVLYLLLLIGYLFSIFKRRNWHSLGQVIFYLALMYLGFSMLHQSWVDIAGEPATAPFLRELILNPWLGFLLGLFVTFILRCSTTTVVITQGLVGVELALAFPVFLNGAAALIIGACVGRSLHNIFSGGLDRFTTTKRPALLLFGFNLLMGMIWLIFLPDAVQAVMVISKQAGFYFIWFATKVLQWPVSFKSDYWFNVWQLAMVYSLFNLSLILFGYLTSGIISRFNLKFFMKGRIGANDRTYLDRRALQNPTLALILASHEISQMAAFTQEMLRSARLAFVKGQMHLLNSVRRDETIVDELQEQITFYLSALLSQNSLTEAQSHRLAGLLHVVSDVERVGDHANNIAALAEKKYQEQLPFSEWALNEIELFFGKVMDLYAKAGQSLRENNVEMARQIENREENIDKLEEELRFNHILRLNQGKCWPGSGVIYVEMLNNLLRVAAHSANIAFVVAKEGEINGRSQK